MISFTVARVNKETVFTPHVGIRYEKCKYLSAKEKSEHFDETVEMSREPFFAPASKLKL